MRLHAMLPAAALALSFTPVPSGLVRTVPSARTVEPVQDRALAQAIPADALAAAWIEDVDELRDTLKGNVWYRFFLDEQMQSTWHGLVDWFGDARDTGAESAEGEQGDGGGELDPREAWSSIHGSLAAFVAPTDDSDEPAFGVLVRPGAERDAFDAFFDRFLSEAEERGVPSAADYAGVELRVIEGRGGDATGSTVFFELADLSAVVGAPDEETALELAHGVIERWQTGSQEGLDGSLLLDEARRKTGIDGSLEAFVDVQRSIAWAMQDEGDDEEWELVKETLHLDDIHWVHARGGFGAGEHFDQVVTVDIPEEGLLREMFDCMGPAPIELARLVPAGCNALNLYNIDLLRLWNVILRTIHEFDPSFEDEELAEMETQFGFDLSDEMLAHVTGEFVQFSMTVPEQEWLIANPQMAWLDEEVTSKLPRIGAALVGRLNDGAALEVTITHALESMGMAPMIETEDFLGFTVRRMDLGGTEIAWAVTPERIVISNYPTALRAALRRLADASGPSLVDDELFGPELKRHERVSILGITRTADVLRAWIQIAEIPLAMFGGMLGNGAVPPDLPDATIVDRYFKGTMVWGVEVRDSLRISFSTR